VSNIKKSVLDQINNILSSIIEVILYIIIVSYIFFGMEFITPNQCRAARGLLHWSQPDLAKQCGMHLQTISNFEAERSTPSKSSLEKITRAFEYAGIQFTEYNGVREKPSDLRIYRGNTGFREFYEDLFKVAKEEGGDLWLYNGVSKLVIEGLGEDYVKMHKERMTKLKGRFTYRVILEEGDDIMFGSEYAHYRWISKDQFNDKTIFVYGPYVALVNFEGELTVTCIHQREFADTMRQLMSNSWDRAWDPQSLCSAHPGN